jgi:hypothetical protein
VFGACLLAKDLLAEREGLAQQSQSVEVTLVQCRPMILFLFCSWFESQRSTNQGHTTNWQFADFMYCRATERPSFNTRAA